MMKILDADAMREVDRAAIDEVGIPSLVLMENAAIGLVDAIAENYTEATSVAILCGPGNNGGDGLALARHLTIRGYRVDIRSVDIVKGRSQGAQVQYDICRRQDIEMREYGPESSVGEVLEGLEGFDLVVDALFGTGLKRPLVGFLAELVDAINALPTPCLAVDIPSGLSGSSSEIVGPHIVADLTVTFGAPKIAHVLHPASESAGEVVVADLGIPRTLIDAAEGNLDLLTMEELARQMMPRHSTSHKGDYGHCLILAGSVGKAGAAILAARAATRVGAGLVTVAAPEAVVQTIDLGSLESMTVPLRVGESGGLNAENVGFLMKLLEGKQVLALGPGLGLQASTIDVVRSLVASSPVPMVIDADAINAFAGSLKDLAATPVAKVLTPHPGELGRLLGVGSAEIQENRVESVQAAARESASVVVLKGHQTLIATADGQVMINPTGNPGMATGGAGDVLTGAIAGLLGQGYDARDAACLGVFLHGVAGDLAARTFGQNGLAAGDIVDHLPEALLQMEQ